MLNITTKKLKAWYAKLQKEIQKKANERNYNSFELQFDYDESKNLNYSLVMGLHYDRPVGEYQVAIKIGAKSQNAPNWCADFDFDYELPHTDEYVEDMMTILDEEPDWKDILRQYEEYAEDVHKNYCSCTLE